jgi:phage shock protein PspC (stress-responsive transcriptional regulator)
MSAGAGIASFSIGISPQLLTFFVVVLALFGLAKLWWGK